MYKTWKRCVSLQCLEILRQCQVGDLPSVFGSKTLLTHILFSVPWSVMVQHNAQNRAHGSVHLHYIKVALTGLLGPLGAAETSCNHNIDQCLMFFELVWTVASFSISIHLVQPCFLNCKHSYVFLDNIMDEWIMFRCNVLTESKSQWGGWEGWWVYNAQDCHSTDSSSTSESPVWLSLENREISWFTLKVNKENQFDN